MPKVSKQTESFLDTETEEVLNADSDDESESEEEIVATPVPAKKKKVVGKQAPVQAASTSGSNKRCKKISGDSEFDIILDNPEDDSDRISNKIRLGGTEKGIEFFSFINFILYIRKKRCNWNYQK